MAAGRDKAQEFEFVDPVPDELICLICALVARDAHQVTCCGKIFCKGCLEKLDGNSCPQCKAEFKSFPDARGQHEIQSLKVKCTQHSDGCQWQGELGKLQEHTTKDCLFQTSLCKYAQIGCTHTPSHKDLSEHENDDKHHLQLAMDTIFKLEERVLRIQSSIKSEVENTYSFKMYNFSSYKNEDRVFFSQAYYTSPNGYKFCIKVYANGYKEGKGTHVSAFACLMKGVNDDSLEWPFTGNITIALANQTGHLNEDRDWELDDFPANDEEVSGRVTEGERQERGWGKCKFIAHADLTNPKCQYLKDDTLVFFVGMDNLPEPDENKAWLLTRMYN